MKISCIVTHRIDTIEPLLCTINRVGHDYRVVTVNTEDGTIIEYYRGRSRKQATLCYDGTISRLECSDD